MDPWNNFKTTFPESSAVSKGHSRNSGVTEAERIGEEHLGFRLTWLSVGNAWASEFLACEFNSGAGESIQESYHLSERRHLPALRNLQSVAALLTTSYLTCFSFPQSP